MTAQLEAYVADEANQVEELTLPFEVPAPAKPATAPPDVEPGKFGTIIADPPWAYQQTSRHAKLSGYSDQEYEPLSTDELCALPVADLAADTSVLLLWATFPMFGDALRVVDAWGFDYVTALAWVKADPVSGNVGYGVGDWFRGAVEPVLVGKRRRSYRSPWVGLIHPGLNHSRKPSHLHEIAETTYPGPRLELFARQRRDGWTTLGNECPGDGRDIRDSLTDLVKQ